MGLRHPCRTSRATLTCGILIRTHQPDARGTDLRVTRLGFESIGPEAGSSLPTDEYGDSSNRRSPGREPVQPDVGITDGEQGRVAYAAVKPVKVSAHAKRDPFGDTTTGSNRSWPAPGNLDGTRDPVRLDRSPSLECRRCGHRPARSDVPSGQPGRVSASDRDGLRSTTQLDATGTGFCLGCGSGRPRGGGCALNRCGYPTTGFRGVLPQIQG